MCPIRQKNPEHRMALLHVCANVTQLVCIICTHREDPKRVPAGFISIAFPKEKWNAMLYREEQVEPIFENGRFSRRCYQWPGNRLTENFIAGDPVECYDEETNEVYCGRVADANKDSMPALSVPVNIDGAIKVYPSDHVRLGH